MVMPKAPPEKKLNQPPEHSLPTIDRGSSSSLPFITIHLSFPFQERKEKKEKNNAEREREKDLQPPPLSIHIYFFPLPIPKTFFFTQPETLLFLRPPAPEEEETTVLAPLGSGKAAYCSLEIANPCSSGSGRPVIRGARAAKGVDPPAETRRGRRRKTGGVVATTGVAGVAVPGAAGAAAATASAVVVSGKENGREEAAHSQA